MNSRLGRGWHSRLRHTLGNMVGHIDRDVVLRRQVGEYLRDIVDEAVEVFVDAVAFHERVEQREVDLVGDDFSLEVDRQLPEQARPFWSVVISLPPAAPGEDRNSQPSRSEAGILKCSRAARMRRRSSSACPPAK